jgi:hypothetical protein
MQSKFIYEIHGDHIIITIGTEILRGVMNFFTNGGQRIWSLISLKSSYNILRKIIKHRTLPQFEIEGKLALLFTFLLVCSFFACLMPLLAFVGIFVLGGLFWSEKLLLLMMSSRPKLNSQIPIEFLIFLMPLFNVVSILYNLHIYGNPRVFPTKYHFFFRDMEDFEVILFMVGLFLF